MLEIDEKWNGKELKLHSEQTFRLTIEENRTTGHSWQIQTNPEPVCVLIQDDSEGGNSIGATGLHHWQFKAVQAGEATLELSYRRAWEGADKAARTFLLHLSVKS